MFNMFVGTQKEELRIYTVLFKELSRVVVKCIIIIFIISISII